MLLSTHSQRLENWLGAHQVEQLQANMKDWYGPPIQLTQVPGRLFIDKHGDFRGHIEGGAHATIFDKMYDAFKRKDAALQARFQRFLKKHKLSPELHGFSSLSDLIAEASAGKKQIRNFTKTGVAGTSGFTTSPWHRTGQPTIGTTGASAPGGTVYDSSTTGAIAFTNPTGGDTLHLVSANILSSVAGENLLFYDRLFSVSKNVGITTAESVTGAPNRYQNTTSGQPDSCDGNFFFIECSVVLPATAHKWSVLNYTDQNGNSGAATSATGNSSNIVNRLDQNAATWFVQLASGDTGIKELDQIQQTATLASGAIQFTIGHPLAWCPIPLANLLVPTDLIGGPFGLERVFDNACIAYLQVNRSTTTAPTHTGTITAVAG